MHTHLTRLTRVPVVLAAALLLAGCAAGGGATTAPSAAAGACATAPQPAGVEAWTSASANPDILPVPISSDVVCGQNRFLFSFLDKSNTPIASPDRTATVAFFDLAKSTTTPVVTATGAFEWAIENQRGVYVVEVTFPEAGTWGAEFTTSLKGGPPTVVRLAFDVRDKGFVKRIGDKAPSDKTPVAADVNGEIARIATDPNPDPALYQTSIDQALAQGKPFLVAFATPKFCTSGQCGPTLDAVKPFVAQYPTIAFINVEPYVLAWKVDQLQPVLDKSGQLTPVQATLDWGLTSEPWIFVVDRTGIIRGSFEGIFGTDELKAALDAVK